jgi:hypothetical protein
LSCSQGLTRTGYISEPSLSEIRAANRLRGQEEKRKKDEEKATREKKRLRKEAHDKENKRREREGHSPETTPESTPVRPGAAGLLIGIECSRVRDSSWMYLTSLVNYSNRRSTSCSTKKTTRSCCSRTPTVLD